ncbi:MAG: type II toxin-antitoxin system HicB family antitoxin [Alphaproteobacteria bacterium]|nr:type II toxin-antitoxin system HicB family antitoxin [Alphaproteobacteria bacterium]
MRYAYPCTLTPDEEGWLTATFPDVPEAGTDGRTREEALTMAQDALATALAGYVHARRDIPAPSALAKGQDLVPLPPVVAAKLALYAAMRAQGVTKVALAAQLGLSEAAVRKLLNPDHRSHIGQVETALKAIGRTLVVEDKAA